MAIVTGDRYLDFLVKFVEKQAEPLLEGTLVLKLNPVGLHYVQSRLEALQELEGLLAGAPVDYLRAYISDLGDHRALEQLRRILRLLTSLKVVSVFPPPARDPTPLSLLPFGRLKVLELRGCDLSTSAARGLLELRHTLEKIICYNSTDALRHVFASRIVDIKDSPVWNRLSFVSCACNGLVLMDESLQLLPAVETLDLSRNKFGKVDNLRKCTKIRHLDLGFNHLRSISSFNEVACSIVKLVLRSNALTSLRGIENLKSVEGLDLSYNIISNMSELEILASLPSLQSLWLEGNPICCTRWYRAQIFSLFTYPEKLELDDRGITTRELWKRQILLASRQKRPAGLGFYSPAKDNAGEERRLNPKPKRLSRLALIEDEEQRRRLISEAVEQESDSFDSEIRSREESAISDGEAEIVDLMNRVEFLKKERSVLWLREFKEWMDQTVAENGTFSGSVRPGEENYMKKMRGRKHRKELSRYMSNNLHASGEESSTSILEPENSSADDFTGMHVYQSFNSTGEAASVSSIGECSRENRTHLEVGENDLKQVRLKGIVKDSLLPDTLTVEGGDMTDAKVNPIQVTVIDEIMGSRSSSAYPGSPPHYQEDILHRRHNLEEEFMQLSAESYSLASSDTDTSFSDDICKSETSLPDIYQFYNKQFSDKVTEGNMDIFLYDGSYGHRRHESSLTRQNGVSLVSSCTDQPSRVQEVMKSDHNCTDDVMVSAACCSSDDAKNQDMICLEKRKGKRRLKRRIVSLSEDKCTVVYVEPLSQKQNGVAEVSMEDKHVGQNLGSSNFEKISFGDFNNSSMNMEAASHHTTAESIKKYFHENVADPSISEICLQSTFCDCLIQKESEYLKSEVAILVSNGNKFYVLLMSTQSDASGIISELMGCHRLEEIKEVDIGVGLQVLRVHIGMDSSYIFITKTLEKSRELLSLLSVCDSNPMSSRCSLKSLEQAQVENFEKHVCGGSKVSIFLYSMILFWCNNNEEKSWLSRSLFVIEGYMLVCVEDLVHFSAVTLDDALSSPYFMLDSCCSISNISEMVIEPKESRSVTLNLEGVTSKNFSPSDNLEKEELVTKMEEKMITGSWKLKWFSEETLVKFVALLKALHAATAISPLPVRCTS